MGGVHASMVASLFPGPVACTPLLSPRSASVAFCSGALWDATAWKPLLSQEDLNQRVQSLPPSFCWLVQWNVQTRVPYSGYPLLQGTLSCLAGALGQRIL